MVLILGKMEDNTKANGLMESNTVKDATDKVTDKKEEAYGKTAKELDGLMNDNIKQIFYFFLINILTFIMEVTISYGQKNKTVQINYYFIS